MFLQRDDGYKSAGYDRPLQGLVNLQLARRAGLLAGMDFSSPLPDFHVHCRFVIDIQAAWGRDVFDTLLGWVRQRVRRRKECMF